MYFVQLNEANVTINLSQIAYVEWDYVGENNLPGSYASTVTMVGGGGFFLTRTDARLLWRAIQNHNLRAWQPDPSQKPLTENQSH